jgi:hypothetical protein
MCSIKAPRPEPSDARRRPIGVNRKRWAPVAAAAAVLVGFRWLSNTGPSVSQGREAFGFDAAYSDADPGVLVVRYGDSGSCPSQAVRHDVVQEPDRVVVTLTRTPMPLEQPCTSEYGARLVQVALTASLGDREVVDGSSNKPIPVSTGSPPFG